MATGLLVGTAGCEDPAADAAAKQKQELEGLKKQIMETGAIQEKRARECHDNFKAHFTKAVGDKRGSVDTQPKNKMGVATTYPIDIEPIGKPIEGVKYVRIGQACEDVNEAYFKNYKQGKWPDETRSDARRHKHATETLAKLKEKAPELPAAVAAYWVKCDKTPFKQYDKVSLNNYACTLQVVWLDASGTVLAAAAGKGEGKPGSAPSTISEKTLQTLDETAKNVALAAAAAEIAKKQAKW